MLKSIFAQKMIFSRRNSVAPFEDINCVDGVISSLRPEKVVSKYNATLGHAKGKIIIPLIEAAIAYCDLDETPEVGALGITLNNAYVAEYPSKEMIHLVKAEFKKNIWQFRASVVRKDAASLSGASLYTFNSYKMQGQAMFFVMMPEFLKNDEFSAEFKRFKRNLKDARDGKAENRLECYEAGAILCDNVYRRCTYQDACNRNDKSGLNIQCPEQGPLEILLEEEIIDSGVIKVYGSGQFRKFGGIGNAGKMSPVMEKAFKKKWNVSSLTNSFVRNPARVLTDGEKLMMQETAAKLGEWYRIPRQLLKAAVAAKETYGQSTAFTNFYFFGESGGGKTSAAMALSLALGIPYVSVTFSANTEILDLLQSIAPEVEQEGYSMPVQELLKNYPDSLECALDPVGSYERVTGQHKDDVTQEDVPVAICEKIAVQMKASGQRFKYVDSPLARAFRCGYLVELQEPNIVANPGVVVGLNSLLDRTATMVCASGEIVTRHPDFVAVDTTNRNYAACRDVNASHLSRFHMALCFEKPSDKETINRVMANTGCSDKTIIKKMLTVQNSMCTILKESGESNYSCGMRELCNWVVWYQILGDAYEAAKDTIIPLSTQNQDLMEDLEQCVLTEFQ